MKEFMMIFRNSSLPSADMSPEQIQASIKQWRDWIAGIAAQGKFTASNQLGAEGRTLKPNAVITAGPYAEIKEMIGGYLIAKAASIEEALKLAEGCPILERGGHVEIRDIIKMN